MKSMQKSSLSLPMTTIFTVQRASQRSVARALDFDLVCVGNTDSEALLRLRYALKAHVEFGVLNGLSKEEIQIPAPREYWDILTPEASIKIGEPIEVDCQHIIPMVRSTSDETERCFSAA
jgi:hypothetical protein